MIIKISCLKDSLPSEPALFGTRKWKMLVAFKCLLEIQSRAAKIDAIGMFFYTEGKEFSRISIYRNQTANEY